MREMQRAKEQGKDRAGERRPPEAPQGLGRDLVERLERMMERMEGRIRELEKRFEERGPLQEFRKQIEERGTRLFEGKEMPRFEFRRDEKNPGEKRLQVWLKVEPGEVLRRAVEQLQGALGERRGEDRERLQGVIEKLRKIMEEQFRGEEPKREPKMIKPAPGGERKEKKGEEPKKKEKPGKDEDL
jgi:hypothetical protein